MEPPGISLGPNLQVRITEATYRALRDLADERGVTRASVVRQALILGVRAMGADVNYQPKGEPNGHFNR